MVQAYVMRLWSSCNVGEALHTPPVSGIHAENSSLESGHVNVEATIRNHHTRLIVLRISPAGTASLVLSCVQEVDSLVGTIHPAVDVKTGFQQNRLLRPAEVVSTV